MKRTFRPLLKPLAISLAVAGVGPAFAFQLDLGNGIKLAQIMNEVVGKAVVVIDQQVLRRGRHRRDPKVKASPDWSGGGPQSRKARSCAVQRKTAVSSWTFRPVSITKSGG